MSIVDWGTNDYYIEISVNGIIIGTSQLLSVPYALYAEKTAMWTKEFNVIYSNNWNVGIGTTTPNGNLHIFDSDATWLEVETGAAS